MTDKEFIEKRCKPCEGDTSPLSEGEVKNCLCELKGEWYVTDDGPPEARLAKGGKKIRREFIFKNFVEAIRFVNKAADIAESEGHHPDIHIFYNKVVIELWTHVIGGLSENDFILAAKIDKIV